MKVRFYIDLDENEMEMVDFNKEGMEYMRDCASNASHSYYNFVVSADWDEEGIFFFLDGPWEC